MKKWSSKRWVQLAAASAVLVGLTACGKPDETAGQKLDNAIENSQQAMDQAKDDASRAADEASRQLNNAADNAREAAAGAADATAAAADKVANTLDAAGTTARVNAALVADPELSALKINVDTKGSTVTLSGTAPNQAAKDRAAQIAQAVDGVTAVENLLAIKP